MMSLEESPSLDVYKDGIPAKLPDLYRKQKIFRLVLAGLVILCLVLAFVKFNQEGYVALLSGRGSVTGVVYDDQGSPIAAEVFVFGSNITGRADANGSFVLDGVPPGERIIVVAYRNVGREFPVTVRPGETSAIGQVRFQSEDFMNGKSQAP